MSSSDLRLHLCFIDGRLNFCNMHDELFLVNSKDSVLNFEVWNNNLATDLRTFYSGFCVLTIYESKRKLNDDVVRVISWKSLVTALAVAVMLSVVMVVMGMMVIMT